MTKNEQHDDDEESVGLDGRQLVKEWAKLLTTAQRIVDRRSIVQLLASSTPLSQLLLAFAAPLYRRLLNLSVIRKALFFLFHTTVLSTIAKFGKMCSIFHQELRLNTWRRMESCRVACQNIWR